MNISTGHEIDQLQIEVENALTESSKAQLAQCARLLATYVSLYKHEFGELTDERYVELNSRLTENLSFGESVYGAGLRELLETLFLVDDHEEGTSSPLVPSRTIN